MNYKHCFLFLICFVFTVKVYALSDTSCTTTCMEQTPIEQSYSNALLDALNEEGEMNVQDGGFRTLIPVGATLKSKMDSAMIAIQAMDNTGTYSDQIPDNIDMLPVGIRKKIGNLDYTLMITNMTAGSQGAFLTAYLRIITPQGRTLLLGAEGIRLNSKGGVPDMKLVLLGDVDIPMGDKYRMVLKGGVMDTNTGMAANLATYAVVGCQGLKLLNLVGEYELSNNIAIPLNSDLEPLTGNDQTVFAPFAISIKDWNDLVIQLSLPAFEMKGLQGVAFKVRNATFDMSDTRNAPNMLFPKGYQEKYYPSGSSMLWRGVYIEELDVILPEQFAKKDSKDRPRFIGKTMIIDNQGISGNYTVQADILPLSDGNASGWQFSVNSVTIELQANKLTKGGFGGLLVLPVSQKQDDKNVLGYSAIITDQDEYFLTVSLKEAIDFDFLMANVTLRENSYVTLAVLNQAGTESNGRAKRVFKPEAVLTGTITIAASNSSSGGQLGAGLDFYELRLMTDAPYFRIKGVQYNGQIKFSNFPVSLDSIGVREMTLDGKDCIGLSFGLKVNIAQGKFSGGCRIILAGYYDKPPGDNTDGKWKFYKVKIGKIEIAAKFSGLDVAGSVLFLEDDPIYGNGFAGHVDINYVGKFRIESNAMFGAKTFRYWYIDARLELPTAITVVGPFMLQGFGGGVYSKMTKSPKGYELPYMPDSTASFGVKALVMYVIAKKELCHGDLIFEINFNTTGGIKYIAFYGSAEIVAGTGAMGGMMDKLNSVNDKAMGPTKPEDADKIASGNVQDVANNTDTGNKPASNIFAYIGIQYNFETSTLEANSEIFINLGVLRGRGPGNRAGWMELHVGPDKWYCYAGTPQDRLGITLGLSNIQLQTGSYFMCGSEMPTFPDPPAQVVRILGPDLYQTRSNINDASLKSGAGFAFGLDLSLRADINYLLLYAHMEAGVGADIMLRQYPDAHCEGSTAPLGLNSWYANGRVYTYLEGEIGVKVDLFFIHAQIPIINGAAAAMMEGGGPNPTWAKGYLRVRFSVLGGKVSGDMQMKMSLGDECKIVNNSQAPVNFKVISDISPATNSTEVDVFTYPQIAFNLGVEDPFEVNDDNGSKLFRVKISTLELSSSGQMLAFTKAFSNNNQTLTLTPENTLPSQSTVQLKVTVFFEQSKNGIWQTYVVNGKTPTEEQIISFKTGAAPSDIPHRNIAFMYPAHQQKNVYKDESNKGYIVLKQWQDYLLDSDTEHDKLIRLTPSGNGKPVEVAVTLSRSEKQIGFDLSGMNSSTSYAVELIARPKGGVANQAATSSTSYQDSTGGYTVTSNQAQNVMQNNGDRDLLSYGFMTSRYTTLSAKLSDIASGISNKMVYLSNTDYLNVRTRRYESFDSTEIYGSVYTGNVPLISYRSLLADAYYQTAVYPAIYKDYPYGSVAKIKERDVTEYGFPPVRAMYRDPEYDLDAMRMPYIDGQTDVYRKDYHDLEGQIMNLFVNGNNAILRQYPQFATRFPEPPLDNKDQIEFSYLMPGSKKGTSGVIVYTR